jgi:hypothetical protein
VAPDKSDDKTAGAAASTSEPKGQELTYVARISLDRAQTQLEDKMVNLTTGMAVTAEIKTGSRRISTYLLSPLLKYKQEIALLLRRNSGHPRVAPFGHSRNRIPRGECCRTLQLVGPAG